MASTLELFAKALPPGPLVNYMLFDFLLLASNAVPKAVHFAVVRCCNHVMSSGEYNSLSGHGLLRLTGALVLGSSHLLISACPSAKEKPPAPLWVEAGTSVHLAVLSGCIRTEKKPSLML